MAPLREQSIILAGQTRRAWRRYLEETRAAAADDYPEVEEEAWRRLQSDLLAIGAPAPRRHEEPPPHRLRVRMHDY